jgi:ABC-type multidrug transport system fused ATPase/permease subunit
VLAGAKGEFATLVIMAPGLLLIGLMIATISALRHADAGSLWRVYLGVAPACVAGVALAQPLASLVLNTVNEMSASAASDVATHETTLAQALISLTPSTPGFAVFMLAGVVVVATLLLWCELVVRTVVLTLLLVLVPVVVPLAVIPSMRRVAWRLAETFLAVAASKFVIVVTLVLGLDEATGSSATEIIAGAVTLLLATCTPFLVLKIVPVIEQSALHHFEGLKGRAARAVANAPSSPAGQVVSAMTPNVEPPGAPERSEDLGLETWPGVAETPMPDLDDDAAPLPAPIGSPRLRGGHVVYQRDESGPVVGWHFDE